MAKNKKAVEVIKEAVVATDVAKEETVIEEIIPATIEELYEYIKARLDSIEEKFTVRPPTARSMASTRQMTEGDAKRAVMGDLMDKSTKACAEELGLSYGQIYSARGGYTFKSILVQKEAMMEERALAEKTVQNIKTK